MATLRPSPGDFDTKIDPGLSGSRLKRYLTEFDFRYTNCIAAGVNDDQRAELALKGIAGRRPHLSAD